MSGPTRETSDEATDVPVHKITSFHGKLSQFIHNTTDSTPLTQPQSPSKASEELDGLHNPPTSHEDSNSTKKRSRRLSSTSSVEGPLKTPAIPRTSKSRAIDAYKPLPRRSPRSQPPSTSLPKPTKPHPRSPKRTRPAPTPSTLQSRLQDTIPENLILLLIGLNPGITTATTSFAYAHPSNLFWRLLHSSGITRIRHKPSDTYILPELYAVGNTNIVARPTRNGSELSKAELDAGVPVLEAKIAAQRPEAVCIVGKSIWEAVWRVRWGRAIRKEEFRYGWQEGRENMGRVEGEWDGAPVFVATTTSGLAASMSIGEKEAIWAELGAWVVRRREEREGEAMGVDMGSSEVV